MPTFVGRAGGGRAASVAVVGVGAFHHVATVGADRDDAAVAVGEVEAARAGGVDRTDGLVDGAAFSPHTSYRSDFICPNSIPPLDQRDS